MTCIQMSSIGPGTGSAVLKIGPVMVRKYRQFSTFVHCFCTAVIVAAPLCQCKPNLIPC